MNPGLLTYGWGWFHLLIGDFEHFHKILVDTFAQFLTDG